MTPESSSSPVANEADESRPSRVNIRNFSVKCGHCREYQTLVGFAPSDEWNVYTYECDNPLCDPERSRTLIEVPANLDEFATRDPSWRGGKSHTGC